MKVKEIQFIKYDDMPQSIYYPTFILENGDIKRPFRIREFPGSSYDEYIISIIYMTEYEKNVYNLDKYNHHKIY